MNRLLLALTLLASLTASADVLITRADGDIVAVEWVERSASATLVHSRFTQSLAIDMKYPTAEPILLDQSIASIEQLVLRVRARRTPEKEITVTRHVGGEKLVATVDIRAGFATVDVAGRRYELALDRNSLIRTGQLTDYGITFERRASFDRNAFPVWPRYGAPPAAPYDALEVTIPAAEGRSLAGTLTMPKARKGRIPAVVLITGSGKADRNNGGTPSLPFREIADAVSRRGVAVLRVDDRGAGASTGDWSKTTTLDEASDIRTAIAFLRKRDELDADRIGLLGWSEGGMIAPLIASEDPRIAFLVLCAAPASGKSTIAYQVRWSVEHDPKIAADKREEEIAKQIERMIEESPRAKSIAEINTLELARKVKVPVLVLHGSTDRHVPPSDAARFGAVLPDVETRLFVGLNHVFLPDPDGSGGFAFLPSLRVPSRVTETIASWIARKIAADAAPRVP